MAKVKFQQSLLNGIPVDIWNDCIELWGEAVRNKKQTMHFKYRLGEVMRKVYAMNLPSRSLKETKANMRAFLCIKESRALDRTYRLVSFFSKKEVDKLIEVSPDGYCIGWGHFDMVMLDYLDKGQMIYYLNYARDNRVPCNVLHAKIMEDLGRKKDPQNRKRIKDAQQFGKVTLDYLSLCQSSNKLLMKIPDKDIAAWMKELGTKTSKSILKQLDQTILALNKISAKLS